MWQRLLWIALAGAMGTVARYGLSNFVQHISGSTLPWGTMFVNVVGCFLFGLVFSLADERAIISDEMRLIILGGFMGAFTTFSTFIFDTGGFMQDDRWLLATGNVVVQTLTGLIFLFVGAIASRAF